MAGVIRIGAAAILVLIVARSPAMRGSERWGLRADGLRCEYLNDPLGVEESAPRLSWVVSAERRGEHQRAYQVLVASSAERLGRDEGDLWDSGQVLSFDTAHITYGGTPLESRQECSWKVRSWDRHGAPGPWSDPAQWEMGLRRPEDWTGAWVEARTTPVALKVTRAEYHTPDGRTAKDVTDVVAGLIAAKGPNFVPTNESLGGDPAPGVAKRLTVEFECDGVRMTIEGPENAPIALPEGRLPYLRKAFAVGRRVVKARLYATALGVYELHLNGTRVGDQHLAPGWTDYSKRVRYQVYDVTDQLVEGRNALGAVVAPGWYSGRAGLFHARQFYGTVPALLAQIEITYANGSVERVVTDGSWRTHAGPRLAADLMDGEAHDARADVAGWSEAGFDDSDWSSATTRHEARRLQADVSEPIRALMELPARNMTEPAPGRWTFDIGQNMVGVVRLRVEGPRGAVVTLRHGEMLNADGTVYTQNLRGARATDTYVCRGDGVETWQPRFTFHGFRYVEVTGLLSRPELDAVTGVVLGSDLPPYGTFSCSDLRLNQLQANIVWGLRGNYLSVPMDCPQRDERMGWMADAQVFLPTAVYNAGVAPFMTKWMDDVADAQRDDGAHSDVAPAMKGLSYGTPAWGDAGSIVPWELYRTYGDTRILERHVGSMIRWVEWCRAHSTGLIRDRDRGNDYGDWLSIGADTPKDLIGTAYFAHSTDLLTRTLRVLGRDEEAGKYEGLLGEIRGALNARYVRDDGFIAGDTQCVYTLALAFDLLPEASRPEALRRLVADIEAKGNRLSTGFVGVSHLLNALTDHGRPDVAHRLLMQDEFPSWLFPVKHGATTIWERWDGWTPEGGVHRDWTMNSFNHYALGSCGRWLFESVAGIAQERDGAGFHRIVIRPRVGPTLTRAEASYRAVSGTIESSWAIADGVFTLRVTIPVGTRATVYVPTARPADVLESGRPVRESEGVGVLNAEPGEAVLSVGSGTYSFAAPAPER
ncbi:MAG: family 78 glycoside hydrolase catalytic domain [Phycisphaerales bacterium]